jgi:hypothetical protein
VARKIFLDIRGTGIQEDYKSWTTSLGFIQKWKNMFTVRPMISIKELAVLDNPYTIRKKKIII